MPVEDANHIFWILFATVLVLAMQVGFLCLETGLTRSKNAINVAMKNAADLVLVLLLWWALGYGLMFGAGNVIIGWQQWLPDFADASSMSIAVFLFQSLFAATAVTIISGAVAERTQFNAYIMAAAWVILLIYPLFGRWSWGGMVLPEPGWLQQLGFIDFAGSTVVHSIGGWVALAGVIVVGPRLGKFEQSGAIPASSLPIAMIGVLFFCIGWIGFNAGSTLEFNDQVPLIILNTLLSAAAGGVSSYLLTLFRSNHEVEKVSVPLNGILGGLVAITAGCHILTPTTSVLVGGVAGVVVVFGAQLLCKLKIDDAVSAIPVHLFSGIWGTLALAWLANPELLHAGNSHFQQFQIQLLGVVVAFLWSFPLSWLFFTVLHRFGKLRVSRQAELDGLNISEHHARTDLLELLETMHQQQRNPRPGQRLPVEPFTEVGLLAREHNRLMDELDHTVAHNQAILTDLNEGILTYTSQGLITSCNPAAARILGADLLQIVETSIEQWLILKSSTTASENAHSVDEMFQTGGHQVSLRRTVDGRLLDLQLSINHSSYQNDDYTCLLQDVSERKKLEHELFEAKEQAQVTLDSIADGVISANLAGRVQYLNSRAEKLTGWQLEEAKGLPLYRVYPVVNSPTARLDERLAQRIMSLNDNSFETQTLYLFHRDGTTRAVRSTMAPIRNREGRINGAVVVFHDVTEAQQLQRKLNYQATHDALTGLVNRREFELRLQTLLDSAQLQHFQHMMFFIDLDQFKIVNDMCGHAAGDELLILISQRMQTHLRNSDTLARLGGDEFGVILPRCNREKAIEIAEAVRADIKEFRLSWGGREFAVGTSIGLVQVDQYSESLSQLLNLADAACYQAKSEGRNRVVIGSVDDVEIQQRNQQSNWAARLQEALDKNRFKLYYQKIAAAQTEQGHGNHFEILLRMLDEDGSEISPGTFIPAAERYHLMAEVDEWVVENTLLWLSENPAMAAQIDLCSINLSGESVGREGFLSKLQVGIQQSGIRAEQLCFEITETEAIADLNKARKFIAALKQMGCRFALDDFGSGLSSFGYLRSLDVDYLKIDGIFIREIHENSVDFAMVQAINTIGHVMGLKTIAEFVTTEASQQILQELGVDYLQGYLIHEPQALETMT